MAAVLGTTCSALAEGKKQLGMDIIILLDCTGSLEKEKTATDPQRNRLDAAVMLVNLADQHSSVTVVPFTDDEKIYTSGDRKTWWNQEFQMSDNDQRRTLCEYLLGVTTYRSIHNGTDLSVGLKYVRENILSKRNKDRRTMLIILSDGKNLIDSNTQKSAEADNRTRIETENIKALGNVTIYTVQFGNEKEASAELMRDIAGSASRCFINLKSTALYDAFSEAFANMIGSARKSIPVDRNTKSIQINIPNNSVAEVNVVLPQNLFKESGGIPNPAITVKRNGETMSENKDYLLYVKPGRAVTVQGDKFSPEGYDYVSLKLLSYHKAGNWIVELGNVDEKQLTSSLTVDVLYNYNFDLVADFIDHKDEYTLNETVNIEAWYSSGGEKEKDENLFREENNQPAVPAIISIIHDGNETVSHVLMKNDQANQRYTYSFPLDQLRSDYNPYEGEYTVSISSQGDDMARTANDISFRIKNHSPQPTKSELADRKLFSDNPFGEKTDDETRIVLYLTDYIVDEDDDPLTFTYDISDPNLVTVSIDGNTMNIVPVAGAEGTATITIKAEDPCHEKAERSMNLYISSIEKRILGTDDNGNPLIKMSISNTNADEKIEKNQDVTLSIAYEGLDQLSTYFSAEQFYQHINVSVTKDNEPLEMINAQTAHPSCVFNVGDHDHVYDIHATASYADRQIEAITDVTLGNTPPHIRADLPEQKRVLSAVDLDNGNGRIDLDLSDYFDDPDGLDDIELYQITLDYSKPSHDNYDYARRFLRWTHWMDAYKEPTVLPEADGSVAVKSFNIYSTGTNRFRINAKDKDNAWCSDPEDYTKGYIIEIPVVSSREETICKIVYGVFAGVAVLILSFLFYRLFIRRRWPKSTRKGAYIKASRDGVQQVYDASNIWWMGLTGKKKLTMVDLFCFREEDKPIDNAICNILEKIKIWYIWGRRIVVKAPKKLDAVNIESITVDDREMKDGKKAKWSNHTSMVIEMIADDKPVELIFERCDQDDEDSM